MAKKKEKKYELPKKIDLRTATFEEIETFVNTEFFQDAMERVALSGSICENVNCGNCFSSTNELVLDAKGYSATCERALCSVLSTYFIRCKKVETSTTTSNAPSEEILINYKDTRNLMKKRGYKRCYMCGGELK